jgi:hypothetical protein
MRLMPLACVVFTAAVAAFAASTAIPIWPSPILFVLMVLAWFLLLGAGHVDDHRKHNCAHQRVYTWTGSKGVRRWKCLVCKNRLQIGPRVVNEVIDGGKRPPWRGNREGGAACSS